jgi:hypothetical protein
MLLLDHPTSGLIKAADHLISPVPANGGGSRLGLALASAQMRPALCGCGLTGLVGELAF